MKNDDAKWIERILAGDEACFHGSREKIRKADTRLRPAKGKRLPHR